MYNIDSVYAIVSSVHVNRRRVVHIHSSLMTHAIMMINLVNRRGVVETPTSSDSPRPSTAPWQILPGPPVVDQHS